MNLSTKIKNLIVRRLSNPVDVIRCVGNKNRLWDVFCPHVTIKNGAKLVVDKAQVAVLVIEGKLADSFGCGQHELVASNMPIYAALTGWKSNDQKSSFDAEVYFVNTTTFCNKIWKTNLIPFNDSVLKSVAVHTSGTYSFYITSNPTKFIQRLANCNKPNCLGHWFNDFIVSELKKYLKNSNLDLLSIVRNPEKLSKEFTPILKNCFLDYGIILEEFHTETFVVYKN